MKRAHVIEDRNMLDEPTRLHVTKAARDGVMEARLDLFVFQRGKWRGGRTEFFPLDTNGGRARLAALAVPLDVIPEGY